MFKLVNAEVKALTPEFAQQFRDLEPSPTERELDAQRVKHLKTKAEAGQLITFNWATARYGNKIIRMNGQHSSTMLCELNGKFPNDLRVHLDEYEVDTPDGLALLFRQFDDRKSSRSKGDVAHAYQGLHASIRDVPRDAAKLAVDGVAWWRRQVEGVPVKAGDDVYELFNVPNLHPFITWIGELFSSKTPELKRVPVVAAIYASFISSETAAKLFWGQVIRGGLEYEDNAPSTVLDTWLKKLHETRDLSRDMKPAQYYQGCVFAWNAFREEKSIKDIKYDVKKGFHKVAE